jgi:predicted small lipoprotein YifL
MKLLLQILVRTLYLGMITVMLAACGQQGPLYLPTQAAAMHRASLPESLLPASGTATPGKQTPAP